MSNRVAAHDDRNRACEDRSFSPASKVIPINQHINNGAQDGQSAPSSGSQLAGNQQDMHIDHNDNNSLPSHGANILNHNDTEESKVKKKFNLEEQLARNKYGVFKFHDQTKDAVLYSKTSLCCMSDTNPLRCAMVWLATWSWFENFITLSIVLNSVMLATNDYEVRLDPTYVSSWTPIQEKIDHVFSGIFIFEATVRITAMGFILQKGSYLREGWNVLDFFIVCISIIGMLPIKGGSDSLKALRTFRILRPLRSVNKLPAMKNQINSLLKSIPGLMRVFFFIIFIFCIFAIFGANQFMGQQYYFCRSSEEAERDADGNFERWPKSGEDDGEMILCHTDDQCKAAFPDDDVAICGAVFEKFGLDPIDYDGIRDIELIMYGIPGFDNVGQGFLTIFQILTLESWVYLMYNYSDSGAATISIIFFCLVVLLGAFFTMNLVLAIIVDNFPSQARLKLSEEDEEEVLKDPLVSHVINNNTQNPLVEGKSELVGESEGNQFREEATSPPLVPPTAEPSRNRENPVRESRERVSLPAINSNQSNAMMAARSITLAEAEHDAGINILSHPDEETEHRAQSHLEPDNNNTESIVQNSPSQHRQIQYDSQRGSQDDQHPDDTTGDRPISYSIDRYQQQAHYNDDGFDFEEDEHEKMARRRSSGNGVYLCLYNIVTSWIFNFFIFILIIGNTITLAAFTYDQSDRATHVLDVMNEFFTWIFVLEMILKIIGLGFNNYIKDKFNLFDAVIVVISLIDWTISRIPDINAGAALNAFRALRLLRMLKLAKAWKALQDILMKTLNAMKDISNFSLLLMLFMYIFALLGMELFANVALVDEDDNLIAGIENIQALYASGDYYTFPRDNYNSVGYALTAVFIAIIGEDWNWAMYQWVRAYGYGSSVSYYIAIFFYLILMIMGNIVLFSLFTAILLGQFDSDGDEEDEEEEKPSPFSREGCSLMYQSLKEAFGQKKRVKRVLNADGDDLGLAMEIREEQLEKVRKLEKMQELGDAASFIDSDYMDQAALDEDQRSKARKKRDYQMSLTPLFHYDAGQMALGKIKSSIHDEKKEEKVPLVGTSLFCLGKKNKCRGFIHSFTYNRKFEFTILAFIIISTITLAFESPLDNPDGQKVEILSKIDVVMTGIFTFEAILKIISIGFLFCGSSSYIRDPANMLDFLIVASALFELAAGDAVKVGFFKALRILKILRPLRIIARNKSLKIAIISLGRSIPNIVRLQAIVLFFVFLFAILQTTLFSGAFYACSTDHLDLNMKQSLQNIVTMWDCINYGGEWTKPELNFDNTFASLLTLVTIQTTEGWIDVMWSAVDAVGPYYQPKEGNNPLLILYMMVLVIIICMLFIELFVGIVTETFNSQKEFIQGNRNLTTEQLGYARVHLLALNLKPKRRLEADYTPFRNAMIRVTENRNFDTLIMCCIMANTFVLGFVWYMQSEEIKQVLEVFNYTFMVIFTIEAILKIIAQRCDYFRDSWNLFDFTVVTLTLVILGIAWAGVGKDLEILGTILRTLRIGRVFRLIKRQQKLQEIFKTLLEAAPSMGSLGMLLMLLIFMFSIIGIAQFALVDLNGAGEMNQHVNFQDFGSAFLTLIRCSTGEAWNSIMFDSARGYSIMNQCKSDESYEEMIADGRDPVDPFATRGCGTGAAIIFHLLFQVIVSQVFLNLFIAIIIDAFVGQTDLANMPVKEKSIEDFQRIWSQYDKLATGFIPYHQLNDLLIDLAKAHPQEGGSLIPFKKRTEFDEDFRKRQIIALAVPTYENMQKVMYYDVLIQLCYQAVKLYFQKSDIKKMQKQLGILKKIGGNVFTEDTLEALHNKNVVQNSFDKAFRKLISKMKEKDVVAEILSELNIQSKKFNEIYNHDVDINYKIIPDENGELDEKRNPLDAELYTTAHRGSAERINNFIIDYLNRRQGNPDSNQESGASVSQVGERITHEPVGQDMNFSGSRATNMNGVQDNANPAMPSSNGRPDAGQVERDPEDEPVEPIAADPGMQEPN